MVLIKDLCSRVNANVMKVSTVLNVSSETGGSTKIM